MDNSVNYTVPYVVDQGHPPGGLNPAEADTLRAVQWTIERLEDRGGELRWNFFELTRPTFATLAATCPLLAPVRLNLLGARHVLESAHKRLLLAENVLSCNTMLIAKFNDAANFQALTDFVYPQDFVRPALATC